MGAEAQKAERTWVERNLKRDLPPFAIRAIALLSNALGTGVWNINCNWAKAELHDDVCVFVLGYTDLSTFDFNRLTRLVIGAHDECIRVTLGARTMNYLEVMMHPRQREGSISSRHPSIEQAIAEYRRSPVYPQT